VVYDFLPDTILEKIENLSDFLGALAFDKWTGNADSRQAVFFRARLKEWIPGSDAHALKMGFRRPDDRQWIRLRGPHWQFNDSAIQGLYFRPAIYRNVRGNRGLRALAHQDCQFPEEIVDQALKAIPPAWARG